MEIKQVELEDFAMFANAGISKLVIRFTEKVQIIIGKNSYGKSSLLRQLSLFPPTRSIFGKKGFKSLTVEHNGIPYRLESEFEKPSSPHAFYEGESNENLNVGRTTDAQRELITEHLGITPFIDDLIMNRYEFPKWTPMKRKEFLMAHNPDDIAFIGSLAKQTASKIRVCKANLTRLNSRKILLEQDILSDEMIQDLEKEKTKIDEDLYHFQQNLMDLEVGLKVLGPLSEATLYDQSAIKRTLRQSRFTMSKLSHIERDDGQRRYIRETLIGDLAACDQNLSSLKDAIAQQTLELDDLEIRYQDIIPDGDLKDIEITISRLERDRDRLAMAPPDFELTQDDLKFRYHEWETLRENLLLFEDCRVPLYSSKKRIHRERLLEQLKYRQSSYQMTLSDLENQLQSLSKRNTISPRDIPDQPCAKNACPLYAHFMEGYEHAESKRRVLGLDIGKIRYRLNRIRTYISAATRYFDDSQIYHDRISWLLAEAQRNPILHSVLRGLDILTVLRSTPNRIALRLKDAYDHIDQYLKLKMVLSDLETAYTLRNRFVGSQDKDTVKLVVSIETLKKSLYQLRNTIEEVSKKRTETQRQLDDIQTFENVKQTVLMIQKNHESYLQILADKHESQCLSFLKKKIEEIRSLTFIRMSEIESTLRSQFGIKERYQEEIVSEIVRFEKELTDLEKIEKALIEIPRELTINFVNGIFEQANRFIDLVWTTPFQIELLKPNDPLNYEFQVMGDNQSMREMANCSEGQLEMLSLAINFALRAQLGHLGLPCCLDESGRTLDAEHRGNLILLLKRLLDDGIISQLFYVSHDANNHGAFAQSETFVIGPENILTQQNFNDHVTIR